METCNCAHCTSTQPEITPAPLPGTHPFLDGLTVYGVSLTLDLWIAYDKLIGAVPLMEDDPGPNPI